MHWTEGLLDRGQFDWTPIRAGESADLVYRRDDGLVYAKLASTARSAELAGERDRLAWLEGRGIACPRVIDWRESDEGACLIMSAVEGVSAADLPAADLLKAWRSMVERLRDLHELPPDQCPFDRSLSVMIQRAVDVVARKAVNPDFLPDEDKEESGRELLSRLEPELPDRFNQEPSDWAVCHGDACMPNFMVDPKSLRCTGLIDIGRLGTADRYADLALMLANARESWTSKAEEAEAFDILFNTLRKVPDKERLAFYLRLDPLTWG